jgi:ribosomal-protein-alanine N-acetyltransferase
MPAPLLIDTRRLQLIATHAGLAEPVAHFYRRNALHFAPWDPPRPADHASTVRVAQSLAEGQQAFEAGRSHRWWLLLREAPQQVIGSVHLSDIVRGPSQSCHLGYAIDSLCEGRGLMHEALRATIDVAFSMALQLHRIQAAVRPENGRSIALLDRLGFRAEGLAAGYLYIDGAWRDHVIYALVHDGFIPPEHWPRNESPQAAALRRPPPEGVSRLGSSAASTRPDADAARLTRPTGR